MAQIQVLNGSGHLTLEWDHENPEEVARIRNEVQHLKDAGYSFFLTENEPADAVAAGRGKLLVERVDDPVAILSEPEGESVTEGVAKRRGRPPREAVAVQPMRGG